MAPKKDIKKDAKKKTSKKAPRKDIKKGIAKGARKMRQNDDKTFRLKLAPKNIGSGGGRTPFAPQ